MISQVAEFVLGLTKTAKEEWALTFCISGVWGCVWVCLCVCARACWRGDNHGLSLQKRYIILGSQIRNSC